MVNYVVSSAVGLLLGIIALVEDQPTVAIKYNETATAIAPDNPTAHHHLGVAYLKHGEPLLARASITRAFELDPNPNFLFDIAKTFDATGERFRALDYYTRFVGLYEKEDSLSDAARQRISEINGMNSN